MAGSLKNIGLTSLDDLFKTDEQRQADAQERVQIVPADQVFPYARQPYSIDRPTQDLAQLMDSIERVGIAEPLIVRPRDGGGYEIIAGHRRDYCAKTIGLETRPVIVREYSDEDADILVELRRISPTPPPLPVGRGTAQRNIYPRRLPPQSISGRNPSRVPLAPPAAAVALD